VVDGLNVVLSTLQATIPLSERQLVVSKLLFDKRDRYVCYYAQNISRATAIAQTALLAPSKEGTLQYIQEQIMLCPVKCTNRIPGIMDDMLKYRRTGAEQRSILVRDVKRICDQRGEQSRRVARASPMSSGGIASAGAPSSATTATPAIPTTTTTAAGSSNTIGLTAGYAVSTTLSGGANHLITSSRSSAITPRSR
jgi:hypothetical protein